MTCNLGFILLIVPSMCWIFNLRYVRMFGNVCGPLDSNTILPNVGDHTLHQLEFGNMPILDCLITLAHTSISINDRLLVGMKQGQRSLNSATCILIYYRGLSEIAKVYQIADSHDKFLGSSASIDADNVSLN